MTECGQTVIDEFKISHLFIWRSSSSQRLISETLEDNIHLN